jgi:hypothetical protein
MIKLRQRLRIQRSIESMWGYALSTTSCLLNCHRDRADRSLFREPQQHQELSSSNDASVAVAAIPRPGHGRAPNIVRTAACTILGARPRWSATATQVQTRRHFGPVHRERVQP